jgi:hypothetical protein
MIEDAYDASRRWDVVEVLGSGWKGDEMKHMKRALVSLAGVYLLFAVIGRFVEGMGAVECGCADDCWCKRPVLSTFRWVFPWGHRGASHAD